MQQSLKTQCTSASRVKANAIQLTVELIAALSKVQRVRNV